MVDKLLKDKTPATKLDLFNLNGSLKIGVDYVVNTNNGYPSHQLTTRERIIPSKAWTKRGSEWIQYDTKGESKLEYENYKEFLKSYIELGYIYVSDLTTKIP